MKTYRIATIPGDGIGREVVPAGRQVFQVLARSLHSFQLEFEDFDWGGDYYRRCGAMMPEDGLDRLRNKDAILFGSAGDPHIPDHITLWGLRLRICQGLDQYANVRPARLLPGINAPLKHCRPGDLDWVIVRENTEGEYAGIGGRLYQGKAAEVAVQSIVFTRQGTERIQRYAFDYARQHGRKKVTSATKSNSMQYNMVFWDDVFREVAADYPAIAHEQQLIDSLAARFVSHPHSLDVVVASNLFGDILTDLGAAITGSMGLAPSANLNPERRYPSLFQAIHGSAPDITGKGIANPVASIWSAQLMLDFLGEREAATLLMRSIEVTLANGKTLTPDLGGTATTRELGEAIRQKIHSLAAK